MIHLFAGAVLARPAFPSSPLEKLVALVIVLGLTAALIFFVRNGNGNGDGS